MSETLSETYDRAWLSAMNVIRDLGEDPDTVVREATETVECWRNRPFSGDIAALDIDEDEA